MKPKMKYKITNKYSSEHIDELLRIHKEEGLTAESLLENAKNEDSIFHDMFEWDNKKAGEIWRLQQARLMINEVKVIINERELYAFENMQVQINEKDSLYESDSSQVLVGNKRVYLPIVEILTNEEQREQLIKRAIREIKYWQVRYSQLNELKPIFKVIEKTKSKFKIE